MVNKETVRKNFSKYAKFYDRHSLIQNFCGQKLINTAKANGFKRILDIGCGTGNYTRLLKEKFPLACIKAVDISEEMVKIAKDKIKDKDIEFIIADAEGLNLGEEFDLISSNVSFQWFENLGRALANYKESLRQGGFVLFSTFGPLTFCELQESLEDFFGKKIAISAVDFAGRQEREEALQGLFREVKVEQKLYKRNYPSLAELLKKIKYTGARGNGALKNSLLTPKTLLAVEEVYKKKFKQIAATYQVFFCKGIK